MAVTDDNFECHNLEGRDTAKHRTMHRMTPCNKVIQPTTSAVLGLRDAGLPKSEKAT